MTNRDKLHGLYVITDPALCAQRQQALPDMVGAAIAGGARVVQYRDKHASLAQQQEEADALASLCRAHDVTFLVNDDVELALAVKADGVHLGQGDSELRHARKRLGPECIIGITCHDQLSLASTAEAAGADYVAFGRFFPSRTKPQAPPAAITVLQQAHRTLRIPIAAIGGITPANAGTLLDAGADMLAVIHGVFGADDIASAAGEYTRLFTLQSAHARSAGD